MTNEKIEYVKDILEKIANNFGPTTPQYNDDDAFADLMEIRDLARKALKKIDNQSELCTVRDADSIPGLGRITGIEITINTIDELHEFIGELETIIQEWGYTVVIKLTKKTFDNNEDNDDDGVEEY